MLFGDAGRGLIAPLRLSGTNEPPDYAIASSGKWTASRCTQVSPDEMPGVTGMALSGNGVRPNSRSRRRILRSTASAHSTTAKRRC